jgi:hypothetical protein
VIKELQLSLSCTFASQRTPLSRQDTPKKIHPRKKNNQEEEKRNKTQHPHHGFRWPVVAVGRTQRDFFRALAGKIRRSQNVKRWKAAENG